MQERRRQEQPTDLTGYLTQLPALVLLDRLPIAVIGVGPVGDIVYANPACAELLGYIDGQTMTRLHLPDLLAGESVLTPSECIAVLQTTDNIVHWNHAQDYLIRTKVSPTMLKRESDPLLLVTITDLTDWLWESRPGSGYHETNGHSP